MTKIRDVVHFKNWRRIAGDALFSFCNEALVSSRSRASTAALGFELLYTSRTHFENHRPLPKPWPNPAAKRSPKEASLLADTSTVATRSFLDAMTILDNTPEFIGFCLHLRSCSTGAWSRPPMSGFRNKWVTTCGSGIDPLAGGGEQPTYNVAFVRRDNILSIQDRQASKYSCGMCGWRGVRRLSEVPLSNAVATVCCLDELRVSTRTPTQSR